MSFRLTKQVLDYEGDNITPTEKLVLAVIASHADEHQCSYPSLDRIATKSALSLITVKRSVKSLRTKNFIKVSKRLRTGRHHNVYKIMKDNLEVS